MSRLREGVRRSVVLAGALLKDTTAGVLDALKDLSAPGQHGSDALERDLELARRHGRWLSEDERAQLVLLEQQRLQRRRLWLLLLVICLLLPPLWLLVPVWVGLLCWPGATQRLLWFLLALAIGLSAALIVFLLWLLLR
jgi:hypothetical protein